MPTPPVEPLEVVFRQVGPGGNPIFYDPARTPAVHQAQFLPAREDTDGLSLIRARYRSAIWSAFRRDRPHVRYRLARSVAETIIDVARATGFAVLNFDPSQDELDAERGEPWAHCVVREINRTIYDIDITAKKRIKEWALAVADGIVAGDVIGPFPEPSDASPYRP